MSMVVKNNLSAVRALNQLNENNTELSKRLTKVSSGMKINSAGDDASSYSISERMRVQLRSLNQDRQNVQNGSAMLRTASGGVEDIINILRTLKEKAIDAANDSNTDEDRLTIQKEVTQLIDTINDVALGNEYNGKRLLSGRYDPRTNENAMQVAKAMMKSLNETNSSGAEALDAAVKAASNGKFASTDALVQSFMNALESYDSEEDFLKDACDIVLTNDDTGAITGKDAGSSSVDKTKKTIVPEQIDVTSWGMPTAGSTTTINGLTLHWPTEGVTAGTLSDAEKQILKGLNSDWTEQCLKLVKKSYGIDFNDPNASIKDINVKFENDSSSGALAYVHMEDGKLDLVVNMRYYNDIDPSSEDGELLTTSAMHGSAGYLDRTLAHEFVHAVMFANIKSSASLPMYFMEGTAELVHGIDDTRQQRIIKLLSTDNNSDPANPAGRSKLKKIFDEGGTSGDADPYAAGYLLMRYLAKQGQGPRDVPLVIQHGTQAGQHMNFYIKDMQTKSLTAGDIFNGGDELLNENDQARYDALNYDADKQAEWLETLHAAEGMTVDDISVKTVKDANIAIRVLDGAIEYALDNATTIGASLQRLDFTETNITTMNENVQASESTIRDADMAKEMTAFTKANVLSQAAQAMLAQASQSPSNVLSLLR